MAASDKIVSLESHTLNGDWITVLPQRGRRRMKFSKVATPMEQQHPWVPTDPTSDTDRQLKIIQKIQTCMKKVESSQFYENFVEQIQNPDTFNSFCRALGSELSFKMVIYGIGSIELYENPRLQLSLAILMRKKFSWIGDIEVFDPVLSVTEIQVLEALGCSVLSVNEQGRRLAKKPTIFYMPHCEAGLYSNLLQANWKVDLLKRIVLFGNSFAAYQQYVSGFKNSSIVDSTRYIMAVQKFADEHAIRTVSDDYFAAFHDSSWHFFSPAIDTELQPV
uniref:Protein SENSITIVITY TO RED LIGHT REDUCED n=1 Tax=Rhizophora mucronata TaxID=61149 RepID=A0A2P2MAQ3_RHIMU